MKDKSWVEKIFRYSSLALLFFITNQGYSQFTTISDQFSGKVRNQGNVGTCSIMAITGLYEAAYFREYGKKIDLSEMWIIRNIVKGWLKTKSSSTSDEKIRGAYLGSPNILSYQFALTFNGICLEKNLPYSDRDMTLFEQDWSNMYPIINVKKGSAATAAHIQKLNSTYQKVFGKDNDPNIINCKKEAKILAPRFDKFKSQCFTKSETTPQLFKFFVDNNIPIYTEIEASSGNPASLLNPGAFSTEQQAHAIIAIGYKNDGTLKLRNSWGEGVGDTTSPSDFDQDQLKCYYQDFNMIPRPFKEFMYGTIEKNVSKNIRKACVLLTPKDVTKICKNDKTNNVVKNFKNFLCN